MKDVIAIILTISPLLACIILGIKILIGTFIRLKKFNFYRNFKKTDGTIETYTTTTSFHDGSRNVFYHPKIKYFVDGEQYTFTTETGYDYTSKPPVGKIIKIKYNPQNPKQACKSFDTEAFGPFLIGVLCISAGTIFLFICLSMI